MKMVKDKISIPRPNWPQTVSTSTGNKRKRKNRTTKRHTQYNCRISMIGKDK